MAASANFSSDPLQRLKAAITEVGTGVAPAEPSLDAIRTVDAGGLLAGLSIELQGTANGAATTLSVTLAGAAGKTTYLDGFSVTGLGATAGTNAKLVITGPTTTQTIAVGVPAGVLVPMAPHTFMLPRAVPSSAIAGAITLTLSTFGGGNTDASLNAWGHQVAAASP